MNADQKDSAANQREKREPDWNSCSFTKFAAGFYPRSSAPIRGKNYLNKFFKIKIALAGRSASRRIR